MNTIITINIFVVVPKLIDFLGKGNILFKLGDDILLGKFVLFYLSTK